MNVDRRSKTRIVGCGGGFRSKKGRRVSAGEAFVAAEIQLLSHAPDVVQSPDV